MTLTLLTLDYEHLASDELERAALCTTQESRTRHLNRASAYAQRAEEAETGSTQSDGVLDIIGTLSAALDELDGSGLTIPALHINQAIVDLGGIGMSVTTTGLE